LYSCNEKQDVIKIGYVQIAQDPSLDIAKEGVFKALSDSGYIDGQNVKILENNAQGDISLIPSILQSLISQNADIIITNSTPCMMAASQIVKDIPVVFTVAFSPQDMGLKTTGENIYGVYDPFNADKFVELTISLIPGLKKIGLPFNNTERNAEFSANKLIEQFKKRDIEVITTSVNSSNDILIAGNYLKDKKVEAIIVGADNVINLGQGVLGKLAGENDIPLIVTEPMNTQKGAAVGFGVSYSDWGYQAGLKAVKILKGEIINNENKITPINKYTLIINKEASIEQNLAISDSITHIADKIIF
jgi:putative ABC transport system substrate-binding protein